jgi:hypothetical protein
MTDTVADVAASYFDAWKRGDFTRLRAILADDVTFDGPLGHAGNAEECIAGLKRMSEIVTDIVIRKTFVDGPDVLTWFELHTARTDPLPTGELEARRTRQDHFHPGDFRPAAPYRVT